MHLGALISYPSNDDDCLHGVDGNGLKSNRQSAHFGDCVISVSKIISKKIRARLLLRPKKYDKKCKKIKNKIAGSIIGPAMAGPTGPFATALIYVPEIKLYYYYYYPCRSKGFSLLTRLPSEAFSTHVIHHAALPMQPQRRYFCIAFNYF